MNIFFGKYQTGQTRVFLKFALIFCKKGKVFGKYQMFSHDSLIRLTKFTLNRNPRFAAASKK